MIDKQGVEKAVKEFLLAIGEDPEREGLIETPARVSAMCEEIFGGMEEDPKEYLKIFSSPENDGGVVIVRDIPVYSVCEHHLLPFIGKAHIAYIPRDGKIIGLSKFARIVNAFARKPQVQERLTTEIADFLYDSLKPKGVAVIIEAEHLCMTMRGIRAVGSSTTTSALRGELKTNLEMRSEVMGILLKK